MFKKLHYWSMIVGMLLAGTCAHGQLIDATFTYQGQLQDNGAPANGTYAMEFILWDAPAGGDLLGSLAFASVEATNGRFTVDLDFGPDAFDGNMRWLELEVDNTILSPRQPITAAPYATFSNNTRGVFVNDDNSFVGIGRQNPVNDDEDFGVFCDATNLSFGGMYVQTEGSLARPFYGYQSGTDGFNIRHYIDGVQGTWRLDGTTPQQAPFTLLAVSPNGNFATGYDSTNTPHLWVTNDDVFLGSRGSFDHTLNLMDDGFVGIGRETPIVDNAAGQSWLDVQTPAGNNEFGGMHIATDATGGIPYYGYSAGGTDSDCFHFYNGGVNLWGLRMGPGGDRITVRGDTGRVGISQPDPQFLLDVNGSAHVATNLEVGINACKPGGGSWATCSDRRYKKNIRDLDGSLDNLLKLRGVTFEYKDPASINERHGQRVGLIAQEVEQVFPEWVVEKSDGYKMVAPSGFEALTVEALRELRQEKDRQLAAVKNEKNAQIAALQDENDELRERLAALEASVAHLTSNQVNQ